MSQSLCRSTLSEPSSIVSVEEIINHQHSPNIATAVEPNEKLKINETSVHPTHCFLSLLREKILAREASVRKRMCRGTCWISLWMSYSMFEHASSLLSIIWEFYGRVFYLYECSIEDSTGQCAICRVNLKNISDISWKWIWWQIFWYWNISTSIQKSTNSNYRFEYFNHVHARRK